MPFDDTSSRFDKCRHVRDRQTDRRTASTDGAVHSAHASGVNTRRLRHDHVLTRDARDHAYTTRGQTFVQTAVVGTSIARSL